VDVYLLLLLLLEGKTDYYARKRLISQAKNKYNTPKYRLVARFTNKDIICQIVYSRIQGDIVLASAYSHELPKYGIKLGLTNYAAAYCTGLLCARRALVKLNLDGKYAGQTKADGQFFLVQELENGPRPFKVFLDVGLRRTTTGSRLFAVMKGAVDGGIYVPHNEKRFPGSKDGKLDSSILRKHIFGQHVSEYMKLLKEEDEDLYKKQFGQYIKLGIQPDMLESIYTKAHEMIRKDPSPKPASKDRSAVIAKSKSFKKARLTFDQRKQNIAQKISEFQESLAA
jgi:large subunit ribosomal protein L5e